MASGRTFLQIASDWLAVRRPTRLAIDGLALIAVSVLLGEAHDALRYASPDRYASGSFASVFFSPITGLSFVSTVLYYSGIVAVAVACARLVSSSSVQGNPPPNA